MPTTDSQDNRSHVPVMVTEVLDWLNVQPAGTYFDGTIGLGGHATAVHSLLNQQGKLIGFDLDEEALEITRTKFDASSPPVVLHHNSYDKFPEVSFESGYTPVNGMLLDLGLSSLQMDTPERGFSYAADGPLDMRFDKNSGIPASELIRITAESDLADLIYKYGEERRSRPIARSIKHAKSMNSIADLTEAIRRVTPPAHRNRSHARVFQALRIAVNHELDNLIRFLKLFPEHLAIGGRIVILSYHSLEDRLVKQRFKALAAEKVYRILTKKPVRPSADEIASNRRARPAKLRAAERLS